MKQAIKDSRWYWYIPIVFFFFIEEATDWAFNADFDNRQLRFNLVYIIMICHLILIIGSVGLWHTYSNHMK